MQLPTVHVARDLFNDPQANLEMILKMPRESILAALGGADGRDHHDWFVELCSSLRMSLEEMFRRIAEGLLVTKPQMVSAFIYELEGKVDGSR